jgi:GTP-binding protein
MQLPTPTPQFVFCQYATIKEPYKRYLENKIRDNWDFSGVPIDIYISIGKNPDASRDF